MSTLIVESIVNNAGGAPSIPGDMGIADAYVRCSSTGTFGSSYNISAVTIGSNNNTYTFTFTNPMPDTGYVVMATINTSTADGTCFVRAITTTTFQVVVRDYDGSVATAGVGAVVYSS